jgi:hypothetical protein
MPKITSPLTSKTYQSGVNYKEYSIPDESMQEEPEIDFTAIDALRIKRGLPVLTQDVKQQMLQSVQPKQAQRTYSSTTQEEDMTVEKLGEIEKKLQTSKRERASGVERLSHGAKLRIEALCGMLKSTNEIDVDGVKFVLRTLKAKEQREAIVAASSFDGTPHAAFEIRRQLLARAIVQIQGTDIELFLGDPSLEARLEAVEEFEEMTLIKLYAEYIDMVQATQNKYFVKTEVEAKEVMEDLKK